jgi:hypothetical protein
MAVMLVVSAVPVLAHEVNCTGKWVFVVAPAGTPLADADEDGDTGVCVRRDKDEIIVAVKDDHGFGGGH